MFCVCGDKGEKRLIESGKIENDLVRRVVFKLPFFPCSGLRQKKSADICGCDSLYEVLQEQAII